MLASGTYDVLVSDVRMPGTGGIELATAARRSHQTLGLVLVTAHDVAPHERAAIDTLNAQLLIKPVKVEVIERCCARASVADVRGGTA